MTGKARKRFLWTGVVLAAIGLVPTSPSTAFGGLAAIDAFHIGRYHLAAGDRDKALEAFNDALRFNPQFVQAYVARGKLYAELGNHTSALADLNFALRLQPTHAEAFAYRGYALLSLGKPQEALPDLDMALRIDPSYARVHFLRGQALRVLGDAQSSAASIALAKRLDPTLEISQVVTAGVDGSLDETNLQIAGGSSPLRTPVLAEFVPGQPVDKKHEADRIGRLVPYQAQMANVAPPPGSRPLDEVGRGRPPLFHPDYRRHAHARPSHPDIAAKQNNKLPPAAKIPDLVEEPAGTVATNAEPSTADVAATPMPPVEALQPIPLPETTEPAPPEPPSEVVKIPAHEDAEKADDKIVHAYPPVGPRIFTGPEVKITDDATTVELTASAILSGRVPEALIMPEKPSAAESAQRMADAIAAARKTVPVEPQVMISDEGKPIASSAAPLAPEVMAQAEAAYRRGLEAEDRFDVAQALAAYTEALTLNPHDPQALCRRGHLLTEQDRTAEALADFDAAIKLAPGLANGYFGRAHVEYITQQFADAVDNFTVALRLDDQHAQSLIERGHCFALLGKAEEAKADRQAALALDPRLARTGPQYSQPPRAPLAMSGATAFAGDDEQSPDAPIDLRPVPVSAAPRTLPVGKPESNQPAALPKREAQSAFQDLFASRRPTATAANAAARLLPPPDAARLEPAVGSTPAANAAEPSTVFISDDGVLPSSSAPAELPRHEESGQPQILPADVIEPAGKLSPGTSTGKSQAAAKRSRAELEAAVKRLDADLDAAPGDAKLYVRRAEANAELGRHEAAIDDLNVALRFNPDLPEALAARAVVHVQLERLPAALVDYDLLVAAAPDDFRARAERGYVRLVLGMLKEAIDDFSIALEMTPDEPSILCRRGLALALHGDHDPALADFAAVLKKDPNNVEALLFRSQALDALGHAREALADLNQAIKLDPNNADALFERSRLYAEKGAYEHAQADRRRALAIDPTLR